MNSVQLIGRLTKDPEIRYNQEGYAFATFTIAIDRPARKDGTKDTDFPRIKCFGRTAENCGKYLAKGRLVGITGRIQTGKYTNREGYDVYTTDVVADWVEFLEWGEEKKTMPQQSGWGQAEPQPAATSTPAPPQRDDGYQEPMRGFEAIRDDDIPF